MYKKFPAAKGIIIIENPSKLAARDRPIIAPIMAVSDESRLNKMAFFFESPEYKKTPKSAISCGISWNAIEIVAAIPIGILMM